MTTPTFRNLPAPLAAVFEQIAIDNDQGHPSEITDALEREGLVCLSELGGLFVPLAVHIEWCQWCTDHLPPEA